MAELIKSDVFGGVILGGHLVVLERGDLKIVVERSGVADKH